MIKDLAYASLLAASTSVGAVAMGWPDLLTRWVLILSGAVFGTLAAAIKFPAEDRGNRAFFSLLTGPFIAMVVLWMTPRHASADAREWIIVISFVASLLAWPVSEWVGKRKPVESTLDALADRLGVRTNRRKQKERDKVHKAVHPSRWGEGKPCECGKLTRGDCGKLHGPDCIATKSEMG